MSFPTKKNQEESSEDDEGALPDSDEKEEDDEEYDPDKPEAKQKTKKPKASPAGQSNVESPASERIRSTVHRFFLGAVGPKEKELFSSESDSKSVVEVEAVEVEIHASPDNADRSALADTEEDEDKAQHAEAYATEKVSEKNLTVPPAKSNLKQPPPSKHNDPGNTMLDKHMRARHISLLRATSAPVAATVPIGGPSPVAQESLDDEDWWRIYHRKVNMHVLPDPIRPTDRNERDENVYFQDITRTANAKAYPPGSEEQKDLEQTYMEMAQVHFTMAMRLLYDYTYRVVNGQVQAGDDLKLQRVVCPRRYELKKGAKKAPYFPPFPLAEGAVCYHHAGVKMMDIAKTLMREEGALFGSKSFKIKDPAQLRETPIFGKTKWLTGEEVNGCLEKLDADDMQRWVLDAMHKGKLKFPKEETRCVHIEDYQARITKEYLFKKLRAEQGGETDDDTNAPPVEHALLTQPPVAASKDQDDPQEGSSSSDVEAEPGGETDDDTNAPATVQRLLPKSPVAASIDQPDPQPGNLSSLVEGKGGALGEVASYTAGPSTTTAAEFSTAAGIPIASSKVTNTGVTEDLSVHSPVTMEGKSGTDNKEES